METNRKKKKSYLQKYKQVLVYSSASIAQSLSFFLTFALFFCSAWLNNLIIMRVTRPLLSFKTSPVSQRIGITKGWKTTHAVHEPVYTAYTQNYLKLYFTIKTYLDTMNIQVLTFSLLPQPQSKHNIISMNLFQLRPYQKDVPGKYTKLLQPWTGWFSRWCLPAPSLWRPRLVQVMTPEREAEFALKALPAGVTARRLWYQEVAKQPWLSTLVEADPKAKQQQEQTKQKGKRPAPIIRKSSPLATLQMKKLSLRALAPQ